jgi:hypothetical protein
MPGGFQADITLNLLNNVEPALEDDEEQLA